MDLSGRDLVTVYLLVRQACPSPLSNWLFNFAVGMFTPPDFVNITWRLFIVFGVLCMAAGFWVFYPETCGKTLEEIEFTFGPKGKKPVAN